MGTGVSIGVDVSMGVGVPWMVAVSVKVGESVCVTVTSTGRVASEVTTGFAGSVPSAWVVEVAGGCAGAQALIKARASNKAGILPVRGE